MELVGASSNCVLMLSNYYYRQRHTVPQGRYLPGPEYSIFGTTGRNQERNSKGM